MLETTKYKLATMYEKHPQRGSDGLMHELDDITKISIEQGPRVGDLLRQQLPIGLQRALRQRVGPQITSFTFEPWSLAWEQTRSILPKAVQAPDQPAGFAESPSWPTIP